MYISSRTKESAVSLGAIATGATLVVTSKNNAIRLMGGLVAAMAAWRMVTGI